MSKSSTDTMGSQLQHLWRTRPARVKSERKIAGVAAGIGRRYGVDPLLIRVAFVVSTIFGGAGIPLYLAAWLAMPDENRPPAARFSTTRTVLLVILLAFAVGTAPFSQDIGAAGLVSAIVMLGGLWLLYLRQPVPPADLTDPPAMPVPGESPPWWPQTHEADSTETAARAWDPLLDAPFTLDLPEPRRRSRLTPVVLGLGLLAIAAASAIAVAGDVGWLTPSRIAAIALAVLGLGLLVGAFRHTGHGLLIIAAPLAGFIVLASLIGPIDPHGGVGDRLYRPTSVTELQAEYRVGVGQLQLDLRGLALTEDRAVDAGAGIGQVEVLVPAGMNIRVQCEVSVGDTNCLPNQSGAGPVLTIHAHSNIGEVVVSHG